LAMALEMLVGASLLIALLPYGKLSILGRL
jgi:hypothetical protein